MLYRDGETGTLRASAQRRRSEVVRGCRWWQSQTEQGREGLSRQPAITEACRCAASMEPDEQSTGPARAGAARRATHTKARGTEAATGLPGELQSAAVSLAERTAGGVSGLPPAGSSQSSPHKLQLTGGGSLIYGPPSPGPTEHHEVDVARCRAGCPHLPVGSNQQDSGPRTWQRRPKAKQAT